jgi:O-antigen/teichoic acid export membrane protein
LRSIFGPSRCLTYFVVPRSRRTDEREFRTGRGGDARSAGRGALALLGLQTAARTLGLAFLFVVARAVTPSEFGRYSAATGVAAMAAFAADLGTSTAITRLVARQLTKPSTVLAQTVGMSVLLGCIAGLGAWGFGLVAYNSMGATDTAIAAASLPAMSALTSVLAAFDGAGYIASRARVTFLQIAVMSVGGAIPVALGLGIRSAILAFTAAPYVSLVVATALARSQDLWSGRLRPQRAASFRLLRSSFPFAVLGGLAILYRRFDIILLSVVGSSSATATYDISFRMVEALGFLGSVLSAPALFLLNRRLAAGDREGAQRSLALAFKVAYLFGLPISAVTVALHQDIVSATLGSGYGRAGLTLAILGAQFWLDLVSMVQGAVMLAGETVDRAVRVSAVLILLLVLLDLALIPAFGGPGAATAIGIFQVVNVIVIRRLNSDATGLLTPPPTVRLIASALVCGAFASAASRIGTPFPASVGVGVGGYVLAITVTRAVSRHEIGVIRNLVSRSPE